MADRYLLESGAPDGYLLEDGSGVLLLEQQAAAAEEHLRAPHHSRPLGPRRLRPIDECGLAACGSGGQTATTCGAGPAHQRGAGTTGWVQSRIRRRRRPQRRPLRSRSPNGHAARADISGSAANLDEQGSASAGCRRGRRGAPSRPALQSAGDFAVRSCSYFSAIAKASCGGGGGMLFNCWIGRYCAGHSHRPIVSSMQRSSSRSHAGSSTFPQSPRAGLRDLVANVDQQGASRRSGFPVQADAVAQPVHSANAVSLRTWIINTKINLIGQDRLPHRWREFPNPRAPGRSVSLLTWIETATALPGDAIRAI